MFIIFTIALLTMPTFLEREDSTFEIIFLITNIIITII